MAAAAHGAGGRAGGEGVSGGTDLGGGGASSVLASSTGAQTLLRDALNAVLNLSGARCAQQPIARHGLWTLVQLWYESQLRPTHPELPYLASMAGAILVNLACHPSNRTLMYRAELQLKTAACSGQPLKARPSSPPPLSAAATVKTSPHGEASVSTLAAAREAAVRRRRKRRRARRRGRGGRSRRRE